jgi:hypothetical protein
MMTDGVKDSNDLGGGSWAYFSQTDTYIETGYTFLSFI